MNLRKALYIPAAALALTMTAAPASAEIVVLSSKRTLSIKSHRVDGDSVILTLRSGGEVTCDKSLIEKILPDEVPYPELQAAQDRCDRFGPDGGPRAAGSHPLRRDHQLDVRGPRGGPDAGPGADPGRVELQAQARSNKGAMGLMQLMPSTAREYKVRNPYDPKANIAAGVKHLKSLIDRWGGRWKWRWPPTTRVKGR